MIADNFSIIKDLLNFDDKDIFYFCQIIKRRKENPGMSKDSRIIKSYYIRSVKEFSDFENEMKILSKDFNARIYIDLNKRSFKRIAFELAKSIPSLLEDGRYEKAIDLYNSMCKKYPAKKNRQSEFYIVDVDFECGEDYLKEMTNFINYSLKPSDNIDKVKVITKTVNGYHLLCSRFDKSSFLSKYSDRNKVELHKDRFTLLYYSDENK